MIIIEGIVGNSNEPHWRARLEGADIDWLTLDQWEAQKSRLRKATEQSVELALSLGRNTYLHDGDILLWDDNHKRAVVARIDLKEVMVIDLAAVIGEDKDAIVRTKACGRWFDHCSRAFAESSGGAGNAFSSHHARSLWRQGCGAARMAAPAWPKGISCRTA